MNKTLKHLITGKDNETADIVRVILLCMVVICTLVMVIGAIQFMRDYTFPIQTLLTAVLTHAGGVSGLILSASGGIKLKENSEPAKEGEQ